MSSKPDLVLINPGSRLQIYQRLGESLTAVEPPVWAGLIASLIRRHGYSVEILDAEAEELVPSAVAERVAGLNPVLAAVVVYGHQPSASTQNMTGASAICTSLAEQAANVPVLLLGGHVASLPERTLMEERANYVCDGEGPYTALELLQALKAGSGVDKVRGLRYRQDGHIMANAPAPLVGDLELEMPGVAWDLLPMDRYRAHNWHCFGHLQRQPYAAMYTTLGCPFRCTFCCIQAPFKSGEKLMGLKDNVNGYRFWTPETIVNQMEHLAKTYGVRNIKIADEMFVLNRRHVSGICDLIIERGLDFNIWAYARVDTIKGEDMLDKLKRAGFNWLAFGIESASERVRKDVDKGFGQDLIFKTIGDVREHGINIIGNYIFGLPEDDHETMQETLDMALDLKCEFGNFYCAMAYPGSPLYRTAVAEGWQLPEKWSGYSQHSRDCLPLPTKHISAGEVLAFRDQAFQRYFKDPGYLAYVDRRFGADTVAHIRDMASHPLERLHTAPAAATAGVR